MRSTDYPEFLRSFDPHVGDGTVGVYDPCHCGTCRTLREIANHIEATDELLAENAAEIQKWRDENNERLSASLSARLMGADRE